MSIREDCLSPSEVKQIREALYQDKINVDQESKKDKDFLKVFPKGGTVIRQMIREYPLAAEIYIFLAEKIDDKGAIVAAQDVLAECLEVSVRSIQRATKWLEQNDFIRRRRLSGSAYVYCFDTEHVWKSWKASKKYAAFDTVTLLRPSDAEGLFEGKLKVLDIPPKVEEHD